MSNRAGLCLILIPWALVACAPAESPVAELAIEPQRIELPYPQFSMVDLEWNVTATLGEGSGQPRVFLHLVDGEGDLVRTFDHEFPVTWVGPGAEPGYTVKLFQSALVPALPEGEYALTVGLYDGDGRTWPLAVRGEEVRQHEYRIATVTATAGGDSPKFFFSPAWLPVEGGTDLQILARRWLAEDGVLRLSEISGAGVLHLGVGIPRASGQQELVLAENASVPAVRVSTTCGDFEVEVSGSGSHTLDVPIAMQGEEAACDISFEANYHLLSRDNMSRRTMALENLSWGAASGSSGSTGETSSESSGG